MGTKIIRDPVHGYINIPPEYVKTIDSIEFQRLKWVEQGSFRVLYPAARHDRFIHSLGTFHIANIVIDCFFRNIEDMLNNVTENHKPILKNTFLYAALLHDIGHAPFSHTCENYFLRPRIGRERKIDFDLKQAIQNSPNIQRQACQRFIREFDAIELEKKPSAHEIISATLIVENAGNFLEQAQVAYIDFELAARMIIGCTYIYINGDDELVGIKNCLIRLINSTTIDIDKLDYITRDTKMSGYDNVPIDLYRLIHSICAIKNEEGDIYPAFSKTALSVINNVFKAKADEGQWIISHPVVTYDSELLKACIDRIARLEGENQDIFICSLFVKESLGRTGSVYNGVRYQLLSDIDILAKMKTHIDQELILEYFERRNRRHPVWKSMYEYIYLFQQNNVPNSLDLIFRFFVPLIDYMRTSRLFVLNNESFEQIQEEENDRLTGPAIFLRTYAMEEGINFDFVLLKAKGTFLPKIEPGNIYIKFSNLPARNLGECTYAFLMNLSPNDFSEGIEFFYLYTKEKLNLPRLQRHINELLRRIYRP